MSTPILDIPEPQATAVMTQVDIDLVDAAGARWAGAKVQVTFVAPPHTAAPFLWNGAAFQQYYYIENVGSSGHLTISLPSNLDITPFGYLSYWRFDIVPNIDDGRNAVITVQVSTTAMDLSSSFVYATQSLIRDLVQSFPVPRSSMDQWVASVTNDGQIYFDSTMQVLKIWANGGWQVATAGGGGGGISYPPSGIAVSQGTAWGASIDPASLVTQTQLTTSLGNYLPLTLNASQTITQTSHFYTLTIFPTNTSGYGLLYIGGTSYNAIVVTGCGSGSASINWGRATSWGTGGAGNMNNLNSGGDGTVGNAGITNTPPQLAGDPTLSFFNHQGSQTSYYPLMQTCWKNVSGAVNRIFTRRIDSASSATIWREAIQDDGFGNLILNGDPTTALQAATKQYVDAHAGSGGGAAYPPAGIPVSTGSAWGTSLDPNNSYLPLTGGVLTGNIIMPGGGPSSRGGVSFQGPANQGYGYVNGDGNGLYQYGFYSIYLEGNGGYFAVFNGGMTTLYTPVTMGSTLTLAADPTTALQAATKQYVDNNLPKVIQVADQATAISDSTANPQNFYFWV